MICRAYKNPISKFNVGQTSAENRGEACGAHIISTTSNGMAGRMDWGFSKKAQF
jgi:hypothetical protein